MTFLECDGRAVHYGISTPMPLAGHDMDDMIEKLTGGISTPMPLAGHDHTPAFWQQLLPISTPMPLAGHDISPRVTVPEWS